MRVALAQISSSSDPTANLAQLAEQTAMAVEREADLVVFPEATMRAFGNPLRDIAEPVDGPWSTAVRDLAARYGISIVAGMFTPGDDGRVRNTLICHAPGGAIHYDKIHLFDAFGFAESKTVTAGDRLVVENIADVPVGFATCYDVRFPQLFQQLAIDGAQLIVVAASWGAGPGKVEQWELLVRARALDSTCFVAACGQAEPQDGATSSAPTGVGHSMIVAPDGEVLARLGAEPGLLVADLDFERLHRVRQLLPVLVNARRFDAQRVV